MARIPYPDPAELDGETAAYLDRLAPLNIFRLLAGGEGLLPAFTRFGNHLLTRTELDPVLRELAIVRVGVLSGATYEVHQHEALSRQLGIGDDVIAAVHVGPDDPALDGLARLVVAYTDDVVANVRASDATFEPLRERLSTRALLELTITIGYYLMVARFLETFDVEIEAPGTAGLDLGPRGPS